MTYNLSIKFKIYFSVIIIISFSITFFCVFFFYLKTKSVQSALHILKEETVEDRDHSKGAEKIKFSEKADTGSSSCRNSSSEESSERKTV